jgi:hypothetical protein
MIKKFICVILGHIYVIEKVMNYGARKIGCTRCGNQWAMHDGTRSFVEWDGEFDSLYASCGILAEEEKLESHNENLTDIKLPDSFGDIETLYNSRIWLQAALEAAGADINGGGIGCGQSDLDISLDGFNFNVSIKPK